MHDVSIKINYTGTACSQETTARVGFGTTLDATRQRARAFDIDEEEGEVADRRPSASSQNIQHVTTAVGRDERRTILPLRDCGMFHV